MDAKSFKQQVLPHYDIMYRYAYYILWDKDDALDAVQETVTSLWERRETLKNVASIEAFCVSSVKNQSIDLLRKRPRNIESLDTVLNIQEPSPSVIERLEKIEALERVSAIIETFTSLQQEIIRLRAKGECSLKEIASITSLSEENVRQVLSRTRRKIKEIYNKIQ